MAYKKSLQDSLGIAEIITALENSSLPSHKKIAYLTMIEDGSFSLQALRDLELDIAGISEKKKARLEKREAEIRDLKKKKSEADAKLAELAIQSLQDYQHNISVFLEYTAKTKETVLEKGHEKDIKKIRQSLLKKS